MYSLLSPPFTEYANDVSGRTRMPKLNQDQLFFFYMSYPAIAEQQRIVSYLDNLQSKVDILKRKQAEISAELNAMLPSVLDKAFKGEL
jgi:type I restriction enzyme, S subunit